jgi:protein TonB
MTVGTAERTEIRRSLQRNIWKGLLVSVVAHLALLGAYIATQLAAADIDAPVVSVRIMKYSELGPPPSMINADQVPLASIAVAAAKPSVGIPVPVPDVEVNPEQTIATQAELSQAPGPVLQEGTKGENVVVERSPEIAIEEEPSPDAFIPVEKLPVAVRQVRPEYPDIARRAGIEGTVWVKILVDKEGRVKKAIVLKSDSEIFDEPAIKAALQWVFAPAMMNKGPVAVWVALPFRFQLNKPIL